MWAKCVAKKKDIPQYLFAKIDFGHQNKQTPLCNSKVGKENNIQIIKKNYICISKKDIRLHALTLARP